MLKVTDNGLTITLVGDSARSGVWQGGLFWFASALMIGAVAVLMAMSILPERLSIGLLGLLVVGMFAFNWWRQRGEADTTVIDYGILHVTNGAFEWQTVGKRRTIRLAPDDRIQISNSPVKLTVYNANGNSKQTIVGFELLKEAQVMQAVLEGKQLGKKLANIKMQG